MPYLPFSHGAPLRAGHVLYAFFLLLLIGLCCAGSAAALSNDLHQKLVNESPEFTQSEMNLSEAWKAVMALLTGDVRKSVLEEQREWLRTERDSHAKSLKERAGISDARAYTMVTDAQTRKISGLLDQLNGAGQTRLTGQIVSGHNEAGYFYALRVLDVWRDYNIGYIWDFVEGSPMAEVLANLVDKENQAVVSGVLTSLHILKLESVTPAGALSLAAPTEQTPQSMTAPQPRLLELPSPDGDRMPL